MTSTVTNELRELFRNGGIRELVIKEIESSEKGFTAEELNTKIGTRVSVQLHQFVK
jgi:hypothetical protein